MVQPQFARSMVAHFSVERGATPSRGAFWLRIALVGAILGGGAGLMAGAVMVALAGGAPDGFEVPWATLLVAGIMGVVVAMVAAWQPARLASRISIIRALQFE